MDIPRSVNGITPAWLTEALREWRAIKNTAVESFTIMRIGEDEGISGGRLQRLEIDFVSYEQGAPQSLIVKLSPSDPEIRTTMKGINMRESQFYIELAAKSDLPVPRCYYGDFETKTGASILLLEDLSHYRSVDFLVGCGSRDAKNVIRALAAIHARWWNDPQLKELGGSSILREFPFDTLWSQYPSKVAELLPGFWIPDTLFTIGDFVAANMDSVFVLLYETEPVSCLHRDVQADNLLFGQGSGDVASIVLDWQLVGKGRSTYDVAYFLISSVPTELRRQIERELLRTYHTLLVQSRIRDYSFDQCWSDYILSTVGKLYVTVIATVLLDNTSPHRRAGRQADLQRLLAFCMDHNVAELLASL